MSFNAIGEYKIVAKISEFTVYFWLNIVFVYSASPFETSL